MPKKEVKKIKTRTKKTSSKARKVGSKKTVKRRSSVKVSGKEQKIKKKKTEREGILPMDVLADKAWEVYRKNIKTLTGIAVIPLIFVFFLNWITPSLLGADRKLGINLFEINDIYSFIILPFVLGILGNFFYCWLYAGLILAIKKRKKASIKESLAFGIKKFFPLFWITLLVGIIVFGWGLLFIIPGLMLAIWFCLANFVLVYEGKGGMEAILRSKDLITGYWWKIFWRVVAISSIIFIIILSVSLLVIYPVLTFLGEGGKEAGSIFQIAIQALVYLFVIPYSFVFFCLIFEDLRRIKREVPPGDFRGLRKVGFVLPGALGTFVLLTSSAMKVTVFMSLLSIFSWMSPFGGSNIVQDSIRIGNLLEAEAGLKQYFLKMEEYPGDPGSNQWSILNKELENYIEPLPENSNKGEIYEYWISDTSDNYILKTDITATNNKLDYDIDGYPLGRSAVCCGQQSAAEKEYCIGSFSPLIISEESD